MTTRLMSMSAEERLALITAIKQLPENQVSVIVLHYFYGHPFEDVAKTLHLSIAEILVQHHAALLKLRRWMHKFDGI